MVVFFLLQLKAYGAVSLALSSSPSNLSPFSSTDANSQNLNRLVHLSLTDFGKDMRFVCRLCKSFEQRFEDEKHIIRFHLDPTAKFWDGTAVTAIDVKKSWQYFTEEKKIKSIFRFAFSSIKDVIVIDEKTVDLVYKEFSLENLSNLALLKIIKIEKYKELESVELEDIVGAGPYKYKDIKTLEISLNPLREDLPELIFKVVRDETTLALKLMNKEIDLSLAKMSPRKENWLKKKSGDLNFWSVPGATYVYLGLNHQSSFLSEKLGRLALAHLIPKKELVKYKLKGSATLATGLFSKAFEDFYLQDSGPEYNPEVASKILSEMGYTKDDKGFWKKDGKNISLDWKVSNNKSTIEVVEVIKNYLNQNGLVVNLTIQEWGTFMRSVKSGDFDIVMSQWVGFTGPDMLKFVFHSESTPPKGGNRGHFIDKEFDKLLNRAQGERDQTLRMKFYKKAAKRANSELAYINMWHPDVTWIGRDCIELANGIHSNGNFMALLSLNYECK
jgi:peptide/nickel transport system substrate-binding protein